MNLSKAILFLCFVLLSVPAAAEEASPSAAPSNSVGVESSGESSVIKLKADAALEKQEAAYKEATKNLPKERLDELKTKAAAYMKTTRADIVIFSTSLQLKHCSENNADFRKNAGKYQSEFDTLRNRLLEAQRAQQSRLRTTRESAVPYIDQKILDDHYAYMAKLVVGLSQGMLEANYEAGGFAKTDCHEVAQKLDKSSGPEDSDAPVKEAAIAARVVEIRQAADDGNTEAMTNLGLLQLSGGTGVPKDTKAGIALLTKAAEKDYGRAQYLLGLIYSSDKLGNAPDKEKAKYWLGKAAAKGDKKAAAVIHVLDKPGLRQPAK